MLQGEMHAMADKHRLLHWAHVPGNHLTAAAVQLGCQGIQAIVQIQLVVTHPGWQLVGLLPDTQADMM
jgi:hypothetical protein